MGGQHNPVFNCAFINAVWKNKSGWDILFFAGKIFWYVKFLHHRCGVKDFAKALRDQGSPLLPSDKIKIEYSFTLGTFFKNNCKRFPTGFRRDI